MPLRPIFYLSVVQERATSGHRHRSFDLKFYWTCTILLLTQIHLGAWDCSCVKNIQLMRRRQTIWLWQEIEDPPLYLHHLHVSKCVHAQILLFTDHRKQRKPHRDRRDSKLEIEHISAYSTCWNNYCFHEEPKPKYTALFWDQCWYLEVRRG